MSLPEALRHDRRAVAAQVRQVGFWVVAAQTGVALALAIPGEAIMGLSGPVFVAGTAALVFLLAAGTLLNERRYASVVTAVCLLQWLLAATVHGTLRTSAPVGVVLVCAAALAHVLNAIRCRAADRSAAAEHAELPGVHDLLYLDGDTGVGAAAISAGRPLVGAHGLAVTFAHLPVVEGDNLVGMVSQRDLLQVDLTEKDEEIRWLNAYIHFIPPVKEGTS